jgi:hypothetical protein
MSEVACIKLLYGVTFRGEVYPFFPRPGKESVTSVTLTDGVFTIVEGPETAMVPMSNVAWWKPVAAAPKATVKPAGRTVLPQP